MLGGTTVVGSTGSATGAAVLKAARLLELEKRLATTKPSLKKLLARYAAARTPAVRHALAKRIAVLEAREAKLAKQIRLLA